jgi:hypothetical protein
VSQLIMHLAVRGAGWTTKIHALTDQWCRPTTMLLSAGQDGDNPCCYLSSLLGHAEDDHRASTRRSTGNATLTLAAIVIHFRTHLPDTA